MLALLGRVSHLGQAHLRDGHLGDIDQYLQVTAVTGNGGRGGCGLQILGGHAHAEEHASATRQSTRHIRSAREVTDHYLRANSSQRIGTFVFAMDQRATGKLR